MKLYDFVNLYDNWNGILVVNDDNLDPIVKNKKEAADEIAEAKNN